MALAFQSTVPAAATQEIPYVPTPPEVVRAMLALAAPVGGDFLMDLGSGDGRIVIEGSRLYGIRARGVEIDSQLVAAGRATAAAENLSSLASFERGDLLDADISSATIVAIYLLPSLNRQLVPRFLSSLKPGARIVSHAFDIGDWFPDSAIAVRHEAGEANVYLWHVPADFSGKWSLRPRADGGAIGASDLSLDLEQRFQRVSGNVVQGGRKYTVAAGRVRGSSLMLELAEGTPAAGSAVCTVSGAVVADTLSATLLCPGSTAPAAILIGGRVSLARDETSASLM